MGPLTRNLAGTLENTVTIRGTDSKQPKLSTPKAPAAPATQPAAKAAPAPAAKPAQAAGVSVNGFDHTATVDVLRDAKLSPAAQGGKRVAETVMQVIGTYDKQLLLDTDGVKAHVQQVATAFIALADKSDQKGSVYAQLTAKYPGAQISLTGTTSTEKADQLVFLVRGKDNAVHKFIEKNGKPVESPKASDEIFMAVDLKPGKHMAVRVPDTKFLINPTFAPDYGVGRNIVVVTDTPLAGQMTDKTDAVSDEMPGVHKETFKGTTKGEDGKALGKVLLDKTEMSGTIKKYNGDKTYDVEVKNKDGSTKTVKMTEAQIRAQNDPMVYNLNGSRFDDVSINVKTDPSLQKFLDGAKAIADKDIPKTGTPADIAKGQRQALIDLTVYCNTKVSYPDEDANTTDANSKKFMAMESSHSNWNPMKLGDLIDTGRGVCRHQAILMQLCCQTAGISSKTVAASANDRQGNFRGYHAFLETTLDDGQQFLTDPTWFDAGPVNVKGYNFSPTPPNGQKEEGTPLWDTLYYQACRQVIPTWNDNAGNQDHGQVKFSENNNNVLTGGAVTPTPVTPTPGPVTPTPSVDAAATLTQILADLSKTKLSSGTNYAAKGDNYAAMHLDAKAAKAYASAIQHGPATKELWTKLATSLAAAKSPDAAAAQAVAASFK
jgi:hypothetical protein